MIKVEPLVGNGSTRCSVLAACISPCDRSATDLRQESRRAARSLRQETLYKEHQQFCLHGTHTTDPIAFTQGRKPSCSHLQSVASVAENGAGQTVRWLHR
nr:hypothetical protein CFP56_70255 [Quercus suber]